MALRKEPLNRELVQSERMKTDEGHRLCSSKTQTHDLGSLRSDPSTSFSPAIAVQHKTTFAKATYFKSFEMESEIQLHCLTKWLLMSLPYVSAESVIMAA